METAKQRHAIMRHNPLEDDNLHRWVCRVQQIVFIAVSSFARRSLSKIPVEISSPCPAGTPPATSMIVRSKRLEAKADTSFPRA
jgi:hypothetical protein